MREHTVKVRMTDDELAMIDYIKRARTTSRAGKIRSLIRRQYEEQTYQDMVNGYETPELT